MLAVSAEKLTYTPPAGGNGFAGNINSGTSFGGDCSLGEVRNANGQCVKAQISRNLFLFSAPPPQQIPIGPSPPLPDPKIHYNFVFIRSPLAVGGAKPIVVPPPQQKTLVYVLSKRPSSLDQEVIEIGANPIKPEVYFVNYGPGDNPDLPGGVSLQEALSQSAQQGQFIDGGEGRTEEGIQLGPGQESYSGPVGSNDLNFGINTGLNLEANSNLDLNAYSSSSASSSLTSNYETNSFTQDSLTNDYSATVGVGVQGLGQIVNIPAPAPIQVSPPASIYSTP